MNLIDALILTTYFAVLIVLAIYGFHRYLMVYLYYRFRDGKPRLTVGCDELPVVTVQLPVFNEMYVVERLIDAVARLNYPRHLLEIQVLDDSTDETTEIARRRVELYKAKGLDIHYLHRRDRIGYKAGALAEGLKRARGELVAMFDADFVPEPDFLDLTVHYFSAADVGMVQVRWGHINQDYSLLTRVQSILLDGHFVLEHGARNRSGRFFNFNGTAGIWRRATIEDAGGWHHDTLTEDMDLSYRAQLRGWRFVFLPHVVSPSEVPVEMNAFKNQQHRWAKGSIQTARKLLPRILAGQHPTKIKVEAAFHLTANLAYPLMVVLSVLMFPSMLIRYNMGWHEMILVDVPLFLAATASVSSFYIVSQKEIRSDWKKRLKYIPFLLAVGVGLSLNNARAVIEGLIDRDAEFVRTPKHRIESKSDRWQAKKYRGKTDLLSLVEIGFGMYFTVAIGYALAQRIFGTLPFLVLFQVGFFYTGFWSSLQGRFRRQVAWRSHESIPRIA
jgi:cellulose synthase/poly-beta-1,6-N-acetylglucosamine synthase-like glycosyltransferase